MSARQKRLSHCPIYKAKLETLNPQKLTFFITTTIKSMQSSFLGRESLLLRKNRPWHLLNRMNGTVVHWPGSCDRSQEPGT